MRRMMLVLALLLLPALPASAQSSRNAHVTQVDSSNYPDVTVYVGVSDAGGQPVGGLSARDFTLTEDGQPVEITGFAGGGASAVTTMLVIDRSGSMDENDKIDGARDAARAFVEQMRPGDRTAVIAFNSQSRMAQDFTGSQNDLVEAIERIRPDGGTALYDSVVAGVDSLKGAAGRRALLVLTDGQDCRDSDACPREYGSDSTLRQAVDYATGNGQPLYVIGLGDRGSNDTDGIDESVLQELARDTGGEYFYAPDGDQLAGLYRKLSADLQQEYALTYRSPRPFFDGTRRDIQVGVGGAPAAAARYVERHLIHVRSEPLVGLLLLLPIVGALLLPSLLRRPRGGRPGANTAARPDVVPITVESVLATGSTIMQMPSVVVIPPDGGRCSSCDAPLLQAGARFCSACGAAQEAPAPAAPRRIFCDQCGRPMRAHARFCSECGATAPVLVVQERTA
jgi:Ca-activated chloride channel homolog